MRYRFVGLIPGFELNRRNPIMAAFRIGDNIVTGADDLFSIQSIQEAMLVHDITAGRTESPSGDIERSKMTNHFPLGQTLGAPRKFDRFGFILRVVAVLEPLSGFGKRGLFTILHVSHVYDGFAPQGQKRARLHAGEDVHRLRIATRIRLY
jgi:hypothetical protein